MYNVCVFFASQFKCPAAILNSNRPDDLIRFLVMTGDNNKADESIHLPVSSSHVGHGHVGDGSPSQNRA